MSQTTAVEGSVASAGLGLGLLGVEVLYPRSYALPEIIHKRVSYLSINQIGQAASKAATA